MKWQLINDKGDVVGEGPCKVLESFEIHFQKEVKVGQHFFLRLVYGNDDAPPALGVSVSEKVGTDDTVR